MKLQSEWFDQVQKHNEFVEHTQALLADSAEFVTLVRAYETAPKKMKKDALRQMANFAVVFTLRKEVQCGHG